MKMARIRLMSPMRPAIAWIKLVSGKLVANPVRRKNSAKLTRGPAIATWKA